MCTKPRTIISRVQAETRNAIASLAASTLKVLFAHIRASRHLSHLNFTLKADKYVYVSKPGGQPAFRLGKGQPIPAQPILSVTISIRLFDPWLVHKEFSTLDNSKSPGPDHLHPQVLKWSASFLIEPLMHLFSNSLATAVVPNERRTASRRSIFKNPGPEDVAIYC